MRRESGRVLLRAVCFPKATTVTPSSLLFELGVGRSDRVKAALQAVPAHADGLREILAERLADCAARTVADPADKSVEEAFWWTYVAAALRVPGTHASIVRLFRVDDATGYARWGDLTTEDAPVIFADTFEGDPGPLVELVNDESSGVWQREAALRALLRLWVAERVDRGLVVDLIGGQLETLLRRGAQSSDGSEAEAEAAGDAVVHVTNLCQAVAFTLQEPSLYPLVR